MRIIVLFNLKEGIDRADYEQWARTRDMPGVRSLVSIDDFNVYRVTGLLGSEAAPPYQYSEIIDVNDMDLFWKEVVQPGPQAVAAEFRQYLAGEPIFLLTEML